MKQHGIFQRELSGQPIIFVIIIFKRGLDSRPFGSRLKGGECGKKLVRMRAVFGVIDRDKLPS